MNVASLDQVSDYLKQEFTTYRLDLHEQPFEANGKKYQNVIVSYCSQKTRCLIVGADYDRCGDQPGAYDNASAVTGLLESAMMVAAAQPTLDD